MGGWSLDGFTFNYTAGGRARGGYMAPRIMTVFSPSRGYRALPVRTGRPGRLWIAIQPGEGYRIGERSSVCINVTDSHGNVTDPCPAEANAAGLPGDCADDGGVCDGNGRGPEDEVSRAEEDPLTLSVADARVEEAAGATVDFAVTLSRAASETVTVDYATADGTATAGSDYRAARDTLAFAPGETSRTVSVAVLEDVVDEGEEYFTLTLSDASGGDVRLDDAKATGTIANDGPIPRDWLARFGRTVASQAVDAIGSRLENSGGTELVLAGQPVNLSGAAAPAGGADAANALDPLAWTGPLAETRTLTGRETLLGSSFRLVAGDRAGGTALTAWGQFSTGRFDGKIRGLRTDGVVNSGFAGVDLGGSRLLAGLAVGVTEGSGDYALARGGDTGNLQTALTAIYPYARLALTRRLDVWGLAGYGQGRLSARRYPIGRRDLKATRHADIAFHLGAAGIRGKVLSPEKWNGLSLVVKSDAFVARTNSDAVREWEGNLAASVSQVSRVRLVLDGARRFPMGARGALTPSLRLGLRRDGGDAETGFGAEAAGGLRYVIGRVTVEVSARSLLAHGASGYREWGASGLVRIEPGKAGRGASLTIAPSWGAPRSGVERLWSLAGTKRLSENRAFGPGHRFKAELGYGFDLAGTPGLVTPYAGLSAGEDGRRVWLAGTRWEVSPETMLAFKGTREDGEDGRPDIRLMVQGLARW